MDVKTKTMILASVFPKTLESPRNGLIRFFCVCVCVDVKPELFCSLTESNVTAST